MGLKGERARTRADVSGTVAPKRRRGRTAVAVLAGAALLAGCAGAGATSSSGTPSGSADSGPATSAAADGATMSVLFVQDAQSGTLTPAGADYDLTLTGVDARTTWFSDRPVRRAGSQDTSTAVDNWAAYGFAVDPPNAALVFHDRQGKDDTVVVELSTPRYDRSAATLTYTAHRLDGPDDGLGFTKGRVTADVPTAFGSASLFIDDAALSAAVTGAGDVQGSPAPSASGTTTIGMCTFPGAVPKPTVAGNGAPAVTVQGPGAMAAASASPMLASAYDQFNTLSCTHYQHTYSENPTVGLYYYDCVGFTSYTVKETMPNAWANVKRTMSVPAGDVPSPHAYLDFFTELVNGTVVEGWQAVPTASALQPGDVLAWVTSSTTEAGHSVLALSTPTPIDVSQATNSAVPAGSKAYALIIMDSTATTHGPDDTRHTTNPLSARNAPLGTGGFDGATTTPTTETPSTAPSGLGIGTIGLIADADDQVIGITWTLGTAVETVPWGAGHPVS